jgi:uncharacterized peroxidase-related enzyme
MTELLSDKEATGEVCELYDEIRDRLGMVPNFFRALAAADPDWLRMSWNRWKTIMGQERELDRKTKEMLALAVSLVNDCSYCKGAHSQMAKAAGASEMELTELREVVELFASFNSIADSLDVSLDEELRE